MHSGQEQINTSGSGCSSEDIAEDDKTALLTFSEGLAFRDRDYSKLRTSLVRRRFETVAGMTYGASAFVLPTLVVRCSGH